MIAMDKWLFAGFALMFATLLPFLYTYKIFHPIVFSLIISMAAAPLFPFALRFLNGNPPAAETSVKILIIVSFILAAIGQVLVYYNGP